MASREERALAALDEGALLDDVSALVRVPSVTGDEREALNEVVAAAARLGLDGEIESEDLAALRVHPDHPGEEAPRTELHNARIRLPGPDGAPRLALCGHVDVVDAGTVPWADGNAFSGVQREGRIYGRGSVDMKAGVIACLHAMAALHAAGGGPCRADLLAVSSEEDGGLGAFAALQRDAAYDGAVIPEPTGFDVVCAQAGAITFTGVVSGVSTHAATRLAGVSAIDRYVPVHQALNAYEGDVNADVQHELMARLQLPYPVNVGKVASGAWSSQVPDRLDFEGRAPVLVGQTIAEARAAVEAAIAAADPEGAVSVAWDGGSFASAVTAADDPIVTLVRDAGAAELGRTPRLAGVPWGADMRLFCAHGIPTTMFGPSGIERAHAVDEYVETADVLTVARTLVRVLCRFGASQI